MSKILYTGNTYNNNGGTASLTAIEEPVKNSIKCRCNICGAIQGYKVSDLKEGNIAACKKCKQGIEIGDKIDSLVVTGYYVYNKAFKIKCTCNKCNKQYMYDADVLKSKRFKCVNCNNISMPANKIGGAPYVKTALTRPLIKVGSNQENSKPVPIKKKGNVVGSIANFDTEPTMSEKFKTFGDFIFVSKKSKRSKTGQSIQELLVGQCVHCGCNTIDTEKNFKKYEYKCKKCDKISVDRINVVENTNWVGYVRHNLEIVKTRKDSNGVLMADTKCLACGNTATMPVISVVTEEELTCIKCGDTPIMVECPLCKKPHIRTKFRSLYAIDESGGNRYFPCGKDKVPVSEVVLQHETLARLDNIRKRYKGYELRERIPGHDGTPDIYKFTDNYTGTDNEVYHTCMCSTHNKLMVLTDDEIRNYKHQFCADTRMMPYKSKK